MESKKGQVAIFVIIAVVIVAGILTYLLVKGNLGVSSTPQEITSVYDYYSSCISSETTSALSLAGTQGGRIYTGDYIPGSEYAPFSNKLNFLGFPVPYWYYVAGNGVIKEQVPLTSDVENDLEKFIADKIRNCNFQSFYDQGYFIKIGEPSVKVSISSDTKVDVSVNNELVVSKGDLSGRKTNFEVSVTSKFGKLYRMALNLYNREKKEEFLENYSSDVLRLYAPVDGVEIQCSPKIWKTREVVTQIKDGLVANLGSIKFEGDYYSLSSKERKYFVINGKVDEPVSVLYSKDWPSRFEVYGDGAENELLIAQPVGNQEGMGMMGFCYVPYHFVYDASFPVLLQVGDGNDIFQFPVVVVIDKNVPRNAIQSDTIYQPEVDICQYNTQDIEVKVSDVSASPIDANISYNCFNQDCNLGQTVRGTFIGKSPACVNGYLVVKSNGYADVKQQFSSNSQSHADIVLDKQYDVSLNIKAGGAALDNSSSGVVSFVRTDGKTISAAIPDIQNISLSEGQYEVKLYIYGNSSLVIPASTKRQCTNVAKSGFLGFFGGTQEQCYDINIPATNIDYAIVGGGTSQEYLLPSELQKGHLTLNAVLFDKPDSLDKLQNNLQAFDSTPIALEFS